MLAAGCADDPARGLPVEGGVAVGGEAEIDLTLRVDVLKKDEKLIYPISVNEVGLVVEYLPHRHGLRHDERNDGRVAGPEGFNVQTSRQNL